MTSGQIMHLRYINLIIILQHANMKVNMVDVYCTCTEGAKVSHTPALPHLPPTVKDTFGNVANLTKCDV